MVSRGLFLVNGGICRQGPHFAPCICAYPVGRGLDYSLFIIHHSSFIIHFPTAIKKAGDKPPPYDALSVTCGATSPGVRGLTGRRGADPYGLYLIIHYSSFLIHYSFTRQRISPTDCTIILHSAFRILHLCHRHIGAHYIHFRIFSIADFSRRETCA